MDVASVAAGVSVAGFAVASGSGGVGLGERNGVCCTGDAGDSDGVAGGACDGGACGSRAPAGHHLLGHHVGHLAPAAHHLKEVIGVADGVVGVCAVCVSAGSGFLGDVCGVWYVEDAGD